MAKNGQVHEGGKVERSSATPTKLFSIDSYNLKFMSFKVRNVSSILLKCQGILANDILEKNISFLFRPSVIRGPLSSLVLYA